LGKTRLRELDRKRQRVKNIENIFSGVEDGKQKELTPLKHEIQEKNEELWDVVL
jgi:hypothetical protein